MLIFKLKIYGTMCTSLQSYLFHLLNNNNITLKGINYFKTINIW